MNQGIHLTAPRALAQARLAAFIKVLKTVHRRNISKRVVLTAWKYAKVMHPDPR